MFLKNSRYSKIATDAVTLADGRESTALRLRRLPSPPATTRSVLQGERLDIIADQSFSDPTRFWHIGDANSALDPRTLVERVLAPIRIPES